MNDLKLKKAQPGDLDLIRSLYWKLLDRMADYEGTLRWEKNVYPADADWQAYIDKGEMYLLCETEDTDPGAAYDSGSGAARKCGKTVGENQEKGKIVGAAALACHQPEGYDKCDWAIRADESEVIVIHLLMVDPDERGRGLATGFLELITGLCIGMGKKTIRLDAIAGNTPAQRLYEKYGYERRGVQKLYYESVGLTEFVLYEYVLKES